MPYLQLQNMTNMSKANFQGALLTCYAMIFSLALGFQVTPLTPDVSFAVCKVTTPVEEFKDELQFAKSNLANYNCINNAKMNQAFLISFLIFVVFKQIIGCFILSSYLFSKSKTQKDKDFFVNGEDQGYTDFLNQEAANTKRYFQFEDLNAMKASYMAQKTMVDAFCNSIEERDHSVLQGPEQLPNHDSITKL